MDERRRRVVRRRRLVAAGTAALAFASGAIAGATAGDEGPAEDPSRGRTSTPVTSPRPAESPREGSAEAARSEEPPAVDRLPLSRQVGRLIVLRFEGPRVPAYVRRALRAGRATGAILFRDNVRSPSQLRRLTRTLRRAGGPGTLVAVDQEGGPIRIVSWAPPATARGDARAAARALRRLGVNVSLAPVADVPAGAGSAIAGRELGATPQAAARAVAAAVRGWRAGHVAPAVKHFPGLGGARVNTDFGSVSIKRSRRALDADLEPFRAAIRAGAPLVMVSHAVYPALDPDHIASQSRPIVTGLLRVRLHFGGVTITDSLEADAARATGRVQVAAEASLRAGVDLLLTTGKGSAVHVHRRLLAVARRDSALRRRVGESAARVERLRRALSQR